MIEYLIDDKGFTPIVWLSILSFALFFIIRFIEYIDKYDQFDIMKPISCKKCHIKIKYFNSCTHATVTPLVTIIPPLLFTALTMIIIYVIVPYFASMPVPVVSRPFVPAPETPLSMRHWLPEIERWLNNWH